jgi:DNA-binding LacI/PurR family transcriptional regulator
VHGDFPEHRFILKDLPGVRGRDGTRQRVLDAAKQHELYVNIAAHHLAFGQTRVQPYVD